MRGSITGRIRSCRAGLEKAHAKGWNEACAIVGSNPEREKLLVDALKYIAKQFPPEHTAAYTAANALAAYERGGGA